MGRGYMGTLYFLLSFAVTLKTVPQKKSTKEKSGNISRLQETTET